MKETGLRFYSEALEMFWDKTVTEFLFLFELVV